MEIGILGPLSAEAGGRSIVPSAGKPRQVLALLAVYANQVVPVPTLIEEIWGSNMPRSSLTTLQTYILQLRRLLAASLGELNPGAAKGILSTRHRGYLLEVQPGAVDVHEYDRMAAEGHAEFQAGDDAEAVRLYTRALELWRGPGLVDVPVGPVLEIELARLEESRLGVLECRVEAELRLGHHSEMLTELIELTARHPLNERLHAQCMTAFYRSGKQWRALEVYQLLRRRIVEELGIEPCSGLQRLHQAMLSADPALDNTLHTRERPLLELFAA
ncbi:BTAD domain-containing putative transcriptional regulator [Streptacidiphilus sp. MAP5-3]|uniref:AfsR/SARP family transcriptional regulator n=1 Tax=unclassified Streptacidiphilus TaxID=2643834 RepID=UPI00351607AC